MRSSVFEAARAIASQTVRDQIRPDPLYDPCIVVAVRKIVVQRRETVALASLLHGAQLLLVELGFINVSPIKAGGIHREARRNRAVGADNHVVLSRAAVPLRETQLPVWILNDPRHRGQ